MVQGFGNSNLAAARRGLDVAARGFDGSASAIIALERAAIVLNNVVGEAKGGVKCASDGHLDRRLLNALLLVPETAELKERRRKLIDAVVSPLRGISAAEAERNVERASLLFVVGRGLARYAGSAQGTGSCRAA